MIFWMWPSIFLLLDVVAVIAPLSLLLSLLLFAMLIIRYFLFLFLLLIF